MPKSPPPKSGSRLRPVEETDVTGTGSLLPSSDDLGPDGNDLEFGVGDRFRVLVGHGLRRLGWLALAAGLAFGSAGIVAASQHSPETGTRPELTWAGDQDLSARLSDASGDLVKLRGDVDDLFGQARNTLKGLTQLDRDLLRSSWDDGANDLSSIESGAFDLNRRLGCDAWVASPRETLIQTYSPAVFDRFDAVCGAIGSVASLKDHWEAIFDGSRVAITVIDDIETWDQIAQEARNSAAQGLYQDAMAKLRGAVAAISDATRIAENLAVVTDVSTLKTWLQRIKQVDDALALLWSIADSEAPVDAQVAAALRAVYDASALLPQSSEQFQAALQVVMYEMASYLLSEASEINKIDGALVNALAFLSGATVEGR
jgi:hypothetical protein